jgi:Arc/MetJ-type ribon-helix-helix transcriptional regulator
MEIELTPEQSDFIRAGIEQGRYHDSADAIHRAMDQWVERERERLELIASLDAAADSIEAGEFIEYSQEALANLPSDVAKRNKSRLAARECASA